MEYEFRFAPVGKLQLRYVEVGEGAPVILIHGLAGDCQGWFALIEALRHRFRVIAFDNRGAGKSTQFDEPVTTADLAADTFGLMDYLGVERAHVVGRSMGGAIAQIMALQQPDRIRSLVLCASFAKLDPLGRRVLTVMREVLEWRKSWADHARHAVHYFVSARFFNEHPDIVAGIERLIGGESRLQAAYWRQNHACLAHDTADDLARILQPTLVLGGAVDPVASLTATAQLSDGLPNSHTVIFEDASHFFLMEQPERFSRLVEDWLDRHGEGS